MKHKKLLLPSILVAASLATTLPAHADTLLKAYAAVKDSTKTEGNDHGVMLNAKDATEPRQVEIGLPMSYTAVSVDGVPAVYYYWPNTTSNHWRGEQLLAGSGLQNISTTAIKFGEIGYGVNSYMERGGEKFKGKVKYQTNTFGAQNFDMNLSGKLAKKTYFTLSTYQNFDPGSMNLKFTNYIDRAQFYTAGLTRLFNDDRGRFSVFYKYNVTHPLTALANYAPFTYDGDGKVSELKGFCMGRDSYLPVDGMMQYRDVKTGKLVTNNLYDIIKTRTHEATALLDYDFGNDLALAVKAKFSHSKGHSGDQLTMGFYEDADATYADNGEAFHGTIQRRLSQINAFCVKDAMFIAELQKKTANHNWAFGINELYSNIDYARSTTQYYHEVAPNPRKLVYNGKEYANLNGSSEYDNGFENKLAAYVNDTWRVSRNFRMGYGARLELFNIGVDYIGDGRFSDFHIGANYSDADGNSKTVGTTHHTNTGLNYAVSVSPTYNITRNFGLTGEINFLQQYRHLEAYSGKTLPYYNHRPFILGRAGIFYNSSFVNLVSAFTYARRTNDYSRLTVMSDNPNEDPVMVGASSGIETMGWTTDAMFTPFKGFKFHAMLTLQSPKYTGYKFEAFNKTYDFSDKTVTKQSKVIIELDPNYTYDRFNIWASFRYYSKQYANVGNSVYFNGRWETFAGASYKANKMLTFNVNVVNFLNQRGAQGTIPGSELITDGSQYAGTIMAGNYIRPFTVEFGAKLNF
ncbi:TonB-dependent receptor [uncultured Prevotella sp.]|uniref:TonB-dependent receptor n=1 Tax=uncultured Prevotella sp. TaxID=159272 RepID=UPI0027E2C1A9|nr:TonB-dependent receptor [uncultured Prevotella sp.]